MTTMHPALAAARRRDARIEKRLRALPTRDITETVCVDCGRVSTGRLIDRAGRCVPCAFRAEK